MKFSDEFHKAVVMLKAHDAFKIITTELQLQLDGLDVSNRLLEGVQLSRSQGRALGLQELLEQIDGAEKTIAARRKTIR